MEEDEREVELSTISAIFPEIVLDAKDPFSATIELPVHPANPLSVRFPVSFEGPAPPTAPLPTPLSSAISAEGEEQNNNDAAAAAAPAHNFEVHQLKYLPSLQLHVTLPEGYPAEKPPRFDLTTSPPWLSLDTIERLQADGERLWEDFGRDQVVFAYIDHLQQAAETGFSVVEEGHVLEVPREHQIALLDYDIKATQTAFEKETFDCGICLDPKKGTVCHKMVDCGHVFCVQCLQDFYNNAITEGDLTSVRCLTPDCAKKRGEAQVAANKKPKTQLSPSELLQIPLDREMVTRYVKLKHKVDLESDRNTIYCPRKWCQGAAKSKKHRKPEGLELADSDDEDSDTSEKGFNAQKDLLSICEDCSFAFCSRCYQGWHGEFKLCVPTKNGELTEEDKASLEYMKMHTTPCPTCTAPSSKTHGCNHMICFKCNTHFCYLCSAWLEPGNPYKHYNIVNAGCYQRLWELEGGDGPQFDVRFANGGDEAEDMADEAWGPQDDFVHAAGQHHDIPEIEEPSDEDTPEPEVDRPPIQREGPLVFRINVPRPPPPAAPMAPGLVDPPRGNARGRGGRHVPFRRDRRNRNINANGNGNGNPAVGGPGGHGQGEEREALQRAWVQRFVQMALVDQEDDVEWDSDDEEDAGAWEIPVR